MLEDHSTEILRKAEFFMEAGRKYCRNIRRLIIGGESPWRGTRCASIFASSPALAPILGDGNPATVERIHRDAPPIERLRDELETIIHPDGVRCSACSRDPGHRIDHLLTVNPLVDLDRQSFTRVSIDDRQSSKAATSKRASETKSIDHNSFAALAAGWRSRPAALTCRRGRLSLRL